MTLETKPKRKPQPQPPGHLSKVRDISVGAIVYLIIVAGVPYGAYLALESVKNPTTYYVPVWGFIFLSIVTPLAIIAIRTQVRYARVGLIDLFAQNFALRPAKGGQKSLVAFEFVRGKYFVEIPGADANSPISFLPRFPMLLHADWMLLFCAVPYMVFSGFGIFLLLSPQAYLQADGAIASWLLPSLLVAGGIDGQLLSDPKVLAAYHTNILTVAGLAFAGAYFFTLRLFLRAVVMFDLSTVTFLRAFAHMVLSVILAVVIYRVMPDWEDALYWGQRTREVFFGGAAPAVRAIDPSTGVAGFWLFFAFVLGFVPDAALSYVQSRTPFTFKKTNRDLEKLASVVPLTLLDGIDPLIAFRLEEANIFDVQNLATFNPIMLHIESPYGIYQTMDWVGQAQLCTVVGPERFMLLKSLHVRTIFDLQNIALGESVALKDAVCDMLWLDLKSDQKLRKALGTNHLPHLRLEPQFSPYTTIDRHDGLIVLVKLMTDDLHVFRLKQLWKLIEEKLKKDNKASKSGQSKVRKPVTSEMAGG